MRSFVISVIIAACIVCGSVFYTNSLVRSSEDMTALNDSIAAALEAEDYEAAYDKIEELKAYLEDKHEYMSVFGNHEELDKIYSGILEMERYTRSGFGDDALAKSAVLGMLFSHLPQNYRLRWENIF